MKDALGAGPSYVGQQFARLQLAGHTLTSQEFEDCRFEHCDFSGATFASCKFLECDFADCNLSLTKVARTRFRDVSFVSCKLPGIDWTRADWPKIALAALVKFERCVLNDSNFMALTLEQLVMQDCKAYDVDFRDGKFARANFTLTDFARSVFGKTDLSGADFTEAINYDIDVFNNTITGARFTRSEAMRLLGSLDIELVD
jgi:fluoroquinolone resistance protein